MMIAQPVRFVMLLLVAFVWSIPSFAIDRIQCSELGHEEWFYKNVQIEIDEKAIEEEVLQAVVSFTSELTEYTHNETKLVLVQKQIILPDGRVEVVSVVQQSIDPKLVRRGLHEITIDTLEKSGNNAIIVDLAFESVFQSGSFRKMPVGITYNPGEADAVVTVALPSGRVVTNACTQNGQIPGKSR